LLLGDNLEILSVNVRCISNSSVSSHLKVLFHVLDKSTSIWCVADWTC